MALEETIIIMTTTRSYAEIYSEDPEIIKKLKKKVEIDPKHYKQTVETTHSASFRCPRTLIRFATGTNYYPESSKTKVQEMQRRKKAEENG